MTCLRARLRHRVTVQSRTRASDGQGGFTETWADDATLWAAVEPVKGYEKYQLMQLQSPVTHTVTLRYLPGVTTAQRLVFKGRVLDVTGVINEDERNATLRLTCVETGITVVASPVTEDGEFFLLEDGGRLVFEDGGFVVFEGTGAATGTAQFLFETGDDLLFEDGTEFLFEGDGGPALALFEDGVFQLFQDGNQITY